MKLLVLLNQLLYPADTGGKIRSSQLFERLNRDHDLTMVAYRRPNETDEQVAAMQRCCRRLELVDWTETPKFTPRFYLELSTNLVSRLPYIVAKYYRPAMRSRIAELLAAEPYDLLLCDFLQPSLNVLDLPFRPKVLFQHNVEAVIRRRHAEKESHPLRKAYLQLQYRRLHAYEARAARAFDHCVMVSPEDCATMAAEYGATNTSPVPLGVDVDYFQPSDADPRPGRLSFTGSMDWLPNEDAVVWFDREILPLLRSQRDDVTLAVVGRNPTPRVQALASEVIEVTGTVDDIRPWIAESEVYVVPLRVGGGTRIKIFEAMAMGKAIVSTTLGAEGLPVEDGEDILLADEPAAFADAVLRLLDDAELRGRLGVNARRKVAEQYSWDHAAGAFAAICEGVVRGVGEGSG